MRRHDWTGATMIYNDGHIQRRPGNTKKYWTVSGRGTLENTYVWLLSHGLGYGVLAAALARVAGLLVQLGNELGDHAAREAAPVALRRADHALAGEAEHHDGIGENKAAGGTGLDTTAKRLLDPLANAGHAHAEVVETL
jgi:hypothetical protein